VDQKTKEGIEKSIKDAEGKMQYIRAEMRPPIKQKPDTPKIAVCIPMGDKDDPNLFTCEKCGHRHFGIVTCEKCKHEQSAMQKLRHAGLAPIEWLLNAWQIVPPLLCSMVIMVRKSVLSAQARNEMTHDALEMGCKYIFYWDDDTVIPPKAIYDLHNYMETHPEAGIITGVYTTREENPEPLIYKQHGQGAYWDFSTKPGILEEIFGAGAGCMMARVEALRDVERLLGGPWWADEHDLAKLESGGTKILWGHDIRFCRRMKECADLYKEKEAIVEVEVDGKVVGTERTMVADPEGPSMPWKVYVAGHILCYHFDIQRQRMFSMPPDSPPMRGNANAASYWDYIFKHEGWEHQRFYPALYERVCELVPEDSKVVDVGCGTGVLLDMLTKKKHIRGYGLDHSEEAIGMLRQKWLEGEVGDIRDLKMNHWPVKETVVVSTETLEHLDDERLERMLSEMAKCKMAIIGVPDGVIPNTPQGEHLREFDKTSLRKLLKKHFPTVRIESITDPRTQGSRLIAVCTKGK